MVDLPMIERTEATDGTVGTVLVATTLALALSLARYAAPLDDDHVARIDTDQTPETRLPSREFALASPAPGAADDAVSLLDEWLAESPQYDSDTWGEVVVGLDEHRESFRKLFG